MIKVNELMVGNWVLIEGTVTAKRIDEFSFAHITSYLERYEPIPLTPELLEKCGFKNRGEISVWSGDVDGTAYNKDIIIVLDKESGKFHYTETCNDDEYGNYVIEIKCLHQLQNLYYALTSEELEINL